MSLLVELHHVAIIVSDYRKSLAFYTEVLRLKLDSEHYRPERDSWMGKLSFNGQYIVELFSFADSPRRPSSPEALGLRHLAFSSLNALQTRDELVRLGVTCEPLRVDENTERSFFFFRDPDQLPLEIYERVNRHKP